MCLILFWLLVLIQIPLGPPFKSFSIYNLFMWERDNSDWSKRQKFIRYSYLTDPEVCAYCRTGIKGKENCKPVTNFNEFLKKNQTICYYRANYDLQFINIVKHLESNYQSLSWGMNLRPAKAYSKNELGEHEEISINMWGKSETGKLWKNMIGCDYDPYCELVLPKEEIKKLMESVPLFNDGDVLSESDLDLKLNIVGGDKQKWLESYDNKFLEIRKMMEERGKFIQPVNI